MCLPGMTEEFRLNVFFHMEQYSNLKLIFVAEDHSPELMNELELISEQIFREFDKKNITKTLEICEKQMFEK